MVLTNRLSQIKLDADRAGSFGISILAKRGQHDEMHIRQYGIGPDFSRQLQAVHTRHQHVENGNMKGLVPQQGQIE